MSVRRDNVCRGLMSRTAVFLQTKDVTDPAADNECNHGVSSSLRFSRVPDPADPASPFLPTGHAIAMPRKKLHVY